jgi:4-amino-4-deoxy-L-arabinose transferase-like glycosyltransferase
LRVARKRKNAAYRRIKPPPDVRKRLSTLPWWCWILLIVLAEALVVLIILPTPWSTAVGNGDGAEYQRYAFNLLHHGVFSESPIAPYYPGVVRSPGYPAFLAALEWIGGRHAIVVQATQFGVLAVMAILVGVIGREVAGPAVGNFAAVLCATYLPFLGYATEFLTEDLTGCLLCAAVLLLLRARRAEGAGIYAALGLVLAAVTFVRPDCALLAVPIVLVLLLGRRSPSSLAKRTTAVATLSAALLIPLVPWIIRDASVTGGSLVPMEASGGVSLLASADQYDGLVSAGFTNSNLWDAQVGRLVGVPAAAKQGIQATVKYVDARRQVQVDSQERSDALRLFKMISLATILERVPKLLVYLWATADQDPPASASTAWRRVAQLQYVLLVVAGLIGLAVRRRQLLDDWPLWLVAACLTLTQLIFHVEARYTLPARPMLMVYAAVGALTVGAPLARGRVGHA